MNQDQDKTPSSDGIKDHEHEENGHVHGPHCNHGHSRHEPFVRSTAKVGRNDACVCGSGKKYKKCCGKA